MNFVLIVPKLDTEGSLPSIPQFQTTKLQYTNMNEQSENLCTQTGGNQITNRSVESVRVVTR